MPRKKFSCALVTGASLGLGRAFARECASRGMRLVLVALPDSGLPELASSIARDRGVEVDWLEADLTEGPTLDRLRELVASKPLAVDLLVNNAGIGSVGTFRSTSIEYNAATVNLNVLALVRLTRLMLDESRGLSQILNVASLGASFPMPTLSIYSATKSFVLNFSLALREELSGSVGVSVLCPNAIRTTEAVKDYLDTLGLVGRLACQTPELIARLALDCAERDKAVIVPGLFNRALAAAGRIVPRALAMSAIRRYWGGFGGAREGGR